MQDSVVIVSGEDENLVGRPVITATCNLAMGLAHSCLFRLSFTIDKTV